MTRSRAKLKRLSTAFTKPHYYKDWCLEKPYQEYHGHMSGKPTKRAERTDVQMKFAVFNLSNAMLILSFLQILKTTCDSNGIHDGTAMCLFRHFMTERQCDCSSILWRISLELLSLSVCALQKMLIPELKKNDHTQWNRELPASHVRNGWRDCCIRGRNYKLQAARRKFCCERFEGFW